MLFLTGILMLLLGIWLWKRTLRKYPPQPKPDVIPNPVPNLEEKYKAAEVEYQQAMDRITLSLKKLEEDAKKETLLREQYRELETQIVNDAIAREARAKAAVAAVLRAQGCTDEEIQAVIENVEGEEDGR